MIQSKFIKIAVIVISLQIDSNAMAMTPGSTKAHWKPENVRQLSPNEVHELNAAKCLVTSYRNDMASPTENLSDKPDEQDNLVLVRGEFAAKGQKDLLVLCKSSKNETEFFKVLWGGTNQCASKLLMDKSSRYMKEYGSGNDYYGSSLSGDSPSETLSFLDSHYAVMKNGQQEKVLKDDYGISKDWLLKKQDLPKLEHDSMSFGGRGYGFIFYCSEKNWIQLYDSFSDITD